MIRLSAIRLNHRDGSAVQLTTMNMKTYTIEKTDGKIIRITVPEAWKVTFGPIIGGKTGDSYGREKGCLALRFYEDEKHQRAIFTNVRNFIDTSIKVENYEVVEEVDEKKAKREPGKYQQKDEKFIRWGWIESGT